MRHRRNNPVLLVQDQPSKGTTTPIVSSDFGVVSSVPHRPASSASSHVVDASDIVTCQALPQLVRQVFVE
jgi:hypothetical protein